MSQTIQAGPSSTVVDIPASLTTVPAAAPARAQPSARGIRAIFETSKPRITRLVTITSAVGFGMAALAREWTAADLALTGTGCLAGTWLSAAGANSLNQWMERRRDARMPRTATRPLPTGRVGPAAVALWAAAMCAAGVMILWLLCGPAPAAVSLATIVTYLLLYTPLKPVTPLATLVGAVPGALPPLIGWTAAAGSIADPGGWTLFLVMFVWQIPHFLAIAWMYREDYAKGGYAVLPVVDPSGGQTSAAILAWSALLLPVTLAPAVIITAGGPGPAYVVVALATGAAFLWLAARLARTRRREDARVVFLASVIHLPVLLVALVADSIITAVW